MDLALGGDLTGTVNAAGDGLTLTRPDGSAALGYTGLTAYDATGKSLPASLEMRTEGGRQELLIHVNNAGAKGPITIDPFVQEAKLTASDGAANDNFGCSVSISGNTVVVGAPTQRSAATAARGRPTCSRSPAPVGPRPPSSPHPMARRTTISATRFRSAATQWWSERRRHGRRQSQQGRPTCSRSPAPVGRNTQTAKLTASDGAADDYFGYSVSISGNTVVVGAPGATVGANSGQGAAYVFTEPGSGWANMTQTAKLTASDGAADDGFGRRFRSAATRWWSGRRDTTVGTNSQQGAAYVFTEPGSGWANMTQTAKLTASDGAAGDNCFGNSVSISGNTVVVGSPCATVGGNSD